MKFYCIVILSEVDRSLGERSTQSKDPDDAYCHECRIREFSP